MTTAGRTAFEQWLQAYGSAWERRDAQAAAALFTPKAEYYWTPFDPPQRGRDEIAAAWQAAVGGQRDVRFTFEILTAGSASGVAHWQAQFVSAQSGEPVTLDGILLAEFDDQMRCRIFREWWHRS